jgi:hypothetical protein
VRCSAIALAGRLLGLVVSTGNHPVVERAGDPRRPDPRRVAVDVEVVVGRLEQQHRAGHPPACGPVSLVVGPVDAQAGAVVLEHAVHDGRVAQRRPQVGVVLRADRLRAAISRTMSPAIARLLDWPWSGWSGGRVDSP